MKLTNTQLNYFVAKALKLPLGKRADYLSQVDFLIGRLEAKIKDDGCFKVKGFRKTGSLMKGTILRPRGDDGVDADVAVYLDLTESSKEDIALLHEIIRNLVRTVYPQKATKDFQVQPRTLGIHFRESNLDVDLVPIIPIPSQPGYGWQPSSQQGAPVRTSVEGQLAFIKKRSDGDPSYRTLVRLLKKWRNVNELDKFGSFLIELLLAHLQDTHGPTSSLEEGVQRFFLYVAQSQLLERVSFAENGNFTQYPSGVVVVLDPVNSNNNVAVRLTDAERKEIVSAAESAWEKISTASFMGAKGDTLELWKDVFGRSFVIED